MEIVRTRIPSINEDLSSQVVRFIQSIRQLNLAKTPGVSETLDLSNALLLLEKANLDEATAEETLGCILKSAGDVEKIRTEGISKLLSQSVR
jgi:hypothetical protein